jgi:1-aminocyclopropane-1-carboxylate deaminase
LLSYFSTPVQEISDKLLDEKGVRLLVKREDLNHPGVSGNKWWKLKYNLQDAARQQKKTLLTFGGAYSNHIYATAAAARECGFHSIGIIRGERIGPLNDTLSFAESCGMTMHFISREQYRKKNDPDFLDELRKEFGDIYLIPEGGTNALAIQGTQEFASTLGSDFDCVCCAVGTGGTLAGLIKALPKKKVIGVSVLKGEFLGEEVCRLVGTKINNWHMVYDYHFGGYAKTTPELENFVNRFKQNTSIPLEHVYTAKLMYAIYDLIARSYFDKGTTILAVHTGGIRG